MRQLLELVIVPSNLLAALALLACVAPLAGLRSGAGLAAALAAAGLALFGIFPGGELLIAPLEARFPPLRLDAAAPPDGIIVLGGGLDPGHAARMGTPIELRDGGERVVVAAMLARRFPAARIVTTGGTGAADVLPEALAARDALVALGVAPERILAEPESLSTRAQATNVARLIGADGGGVWWLVTSAHRMPRAMGTFRGAGLDPTAFPVDFRRTPPFDPLYLFDRVSDGLAMTDAAAAEWVGLVHYRLSGATGALFPGP